MSSADPSGLRRAKDVFLAVVDLPEGERQTELHRLCGDDEELLAEVSELLGYDSGERETGHDADPRGWRQADEAPQQAPRTRVTRDPGLDLRPGVRVGRYTVLEEIGRGGMGVVCAAYDPTLDRKVALKVVRPAGSEDGEAQGAQDARLLREAQGLARLSHPNVVAVYDSGVWRERLYVAMNFIDGVDLGRWLKDGSPTLDERLRVLRAAGRGLAAAHDAGLLHRDFKPENVMIGPGDRVRVVDFGLVRPLDLVSDTSPDSVPAADVAVVPETASLDGAGSVLDSPLTRAGTVIGTPAFLAPEVLRGEPVDARSDQFSFCVALYEAVYQRLPTGQRGSLDSLRRTYAGQIDPAEATGPMGRVPSWLRGLLDRGLAPDPQRRFDDMHRLLAAMDRGLRRRGRATLAVAAGLILVALLAVWGWWYGADEAMCRGEDRMAEAWDADAAAEFRARLARADTPWVRATGEEIVELLDDYAARWSSAYRDACEATRVRGEQSETLLDLRMACLEERRQEVLAVADLLARPGPALESVVAASLDGSLDAASALSPLPECTDSATLRATTGLPAGEAERRRIAEARADLAAARVRRLAADHEDAAKSLARARQTAESLGWQPLVAEVHHEAGWSADAASRYGEAHQHFQDALGAALGSRHDRLAVRALAGLAWVDGYRREQAREGTGWHDLALALSSRLGQREKLEHDLKVLGGALRFVASDLEAAADVWHSELAWHRQTLGEAHPETLDLRLRLAGVLETLGRTGEALELVNEQLRLVETNLGEGHPLLGYSLAQRGNVHFREGRLANAEADFEQAAEILEAVYGRRHARTATALNNLAWVLFRAGRTDDGLALQEEVLRIQQELWNGAHADVASAHGNLAEMYLAVGNAEQAIEAAESALRVMRQVTGDPLDLVSPTSMLGYVLFQSGRPRHAIAPLEESIHLAEGRLEPARVAGARFLLARAYRDAGLEPAHAQRLAESARRDAEAAGITSLVEQIDDWLGK